MTGNQLHLQGIQEPLGLDLAGLHRKFSVGLGALGAVKSNAEVRGQSGATMEVSGFHLGPFTLFLQPKGTETPKYTGLGSQSSKNLPNLAPFL